MSNLVALYADPSKRTPEVTQAYLDYRAGELDIFGNPKGTSLADSVANPSSVITQFQDPPVASEPPPPVASEPPVVSEQAPSLETTASDSSTDINQLYMTTYGRPATPDEIQYHVNRFGADLDPQEAQSLQTEMTSVAGYTPPTAETGEVVGDSIATTPPDTSVSATPYTTSERDLGYGQTETIYRDLSGNVITKDQALGLQAESDAQADQPFVADPYSVGFQRYMDILGREPESQAAQEGAAGLTREQFFQRAIPELSQTSPGFSTFQQVLARDPGLSGLDYYRNVRPDLMQDPRAFRQAAIEGGEFASRARDLYRQNMGFDPSQSQLQGLIQSGTYLNPFELRGAIARQNIAQRPRYTDTMFNPYSMPRAAAVHSSPFPGSRSQFSRPSFSPFRSFAPPQPPPSYFNMGYNPYMSQQYSQPFFNRFQPTGGFSQPLRQPQSYGFQQQMRPSFGGGFGGMGGKGGGRPAPIGGK